MRVSTLALSVLIASPAWAAGPPFDEFPAGPVMDEPSAPPDLSSPNAKAFRTRLREGVRGPANFAGHYNLVRWGCGTSCVEGAVVDRLNGAVIILPSVCCTEHWTEKLEPIDARVDSRLLVLSGKINEDGPDVVHYYVLNGAAVHEARSVPFPDASPATSASPDSLAACKGIVSAVARLDCYDRASGH